MLTRRDILKGMMLAGGFCLLPFGRGGWALAAPQDAQRHFVVIFMRGAVDGLSLVAPYREPNYYQLRRTIALQPPGQEGGLMDLDGYFGLHPSLASLMPWYQNRTLAFIHASGSPATTRSHFEAQDIMETAMLDSALATQGWMNGLAQLLPDNQSPARALAFGNVLPKIFQGPVNISTIPAGIQPNGGKAVESPEMQREFSQLYGNNAALGGLYNQAIAARQDVMQDLQASPDMQKEMEASARGAPGADAFVKECTRAGQTIKQDPRVQLVFMDVGGWDTHVQQGNAKGQLASKLEKFGEGIAALAQGLGPAYQNTVVLVVSEFGRTVAENGNAGTDHGHGNVAWLLGGGVKGGAVYSRWPGLERDKLYEGRDLAVTTDFRSIIGAVASQHFGLNDQRIAAILPGYVSDDGLRGLIV